MILLPCSFVKGYAAKECVCSSFTNATVCGGSLRKEVNRLIEVFDTVVYDSEAVVALCAQFFAVKVDGSVQINDIAEHLDQLEIEVCTEEIGLAYRSGYILGVGIFGGILEKEIGIVNPLVKRTVVAVRGGYGIGALAEEVLVGAGDNVRTEVRVRPVEVTGGIASREVPCPAIELVGKKGLVSGR